MSVTNLNIAKEVDLVTKNVLCNDQKDALYTVFLLFKCKSSYLRGFLFYKSIKFYYNISCREQ